MDAKCFGNQTIYRSFRVLQTNNVEIHYALIDEVNDYKANADALGELLEGRDIPVKLLQYNTRPCLEYLNSPGDRRRGFMHILEQYTKVEYYIPPGLDCGASCGQFLLDYYLKYNALDK